jgi:predicted neutral ceramidase superfamily lipid hydrolase
MEKTVKKLKQVSWIIVLLTILLAAILTLLIITSL